MFQYKAPLAQAWFSARAKNRAPLQIPGHKNRYFLQDTGLPGYDLLAPLIRDDLSLQGGVDDNAYSQQFLAQAEQLWADAVGARHARFGVGGSSQGNMAAITAISQPDIPLILDRTSHRSVHAALVISGARPVWVLPQIHPEFGIPVGMVLNDLPTSQATALFITSPSYVGTISEIALVARLAHEYGIPLVVDQAWGAHLDFLSPNQGAISAGADLVTTSVHKAIMGYSQTAVTTVGGDLVSNKDLNRAIDLLATTSPSGTLMASIDATRAVLLEVGEEYLDRAIAAVEIARASIKRIPGVVVIDQSTAGCAVDPLKLTLWLPKTGVTGTELAGYLWGKDLGVESADADTLVMSYSLVDSPEFIKNSAALVGQLIEGNRKEPRAPVPTGVWMVQPIVDLTPREAFYARSRRVPLHEAVGLVSTEQFCPYPPGVPLIAPGERITEELIAAVCVAAASTRVAYSSDPTLITVTVVAE